MHKAAYSTSHYQLRRYVAKYKVKKYIGISLFTSEATLKVHLLNHVHILILLFWNFIHFNIETMQEFYLGV